MTLGNEGLILRRSLDAILKLWLIFTILLCGNLFADPLDTIENFPNTSYFVGIDGHSNLALRETLPLIPASTMKIVTALLALEKWGGEYRFKTRFFLQDNRLLIEGGGDPYLTSEEILSLAKTLASTLPKKLKGIILDTNLFPETIRVDGRTSSLNPYDAAPGALVANFNTVALALDERGRLISGEAQTPLTSVSRSFGGLLKGKKDRISIHSSKLGAGHFAEILTYYLKLQGVAIAENVRWERKREVAILLYEYQNTKSLNEVLKAMFKYSNNFIANQLFLLLADGSSVTMQESQAYVAAELRQYGRLKGVTILEGAGLSRKNRISAKQLVSILKKFEPFSGLLRSKGGLLRYKTGTLKGVRSLAGYMRKEIGTKWYPFAILINERAPHSLRFRVAESLRLRLP